MKKLLFLFLLFLNSLFAEGTYSGVFFSDYEENSTLYFVNYYNYIDLQNVINNSSTSKNIQSFRRNNLFITINDLDSVSGVSSNKLHDLKQQGHLIDWDIYTDDLGLTLHQTNFLYGLCGLLIGFVFLFASTQIVISEEFR